MRYERKKEENSEVFYEVLENSTKAAEFSYQQKFDETGQVCEKFWIRRIYLEQKCLDYRYLDAILQFIQYKCWCSGCRSDVCQTQRQKSDGYQSDTSVMASM